MGKIRLALIGAGSFANLVHYPSLAEFDDVEMSALCDLDEERLSLTAGRYNIGRVYTDYKKMLEEINPDGVYILMPPHHIFDTVIECLESGANIFIDKPPGITKYQTSRMAELAEKNGCLTMVGFQRRFSPVLAEAMKRVKERGEIIQCMARYMKNQMDSLLYYKGAVDILTCDIIHAVDILRWMGGEAEKVCSDIATFSSERDDAFNALIKFKSGAVGFLLSNWAAGKRIFSVEMHAVGMSAFVEPDEGAVIFKDNMEEGERIRTSEAAGSGDLHKYGGFSSEHRYFIDCLKNKVLPSTNFSDAVKTMDLVEKIYASRITK